MSRILLRARWPGPRGMLLLVVALTGAILAIPSGADGQRRQERQRSASEGQFIVPATAETIRFRFDEEREPKSRTFTLQAKPPLSRKLAIRKELAGDLESETGREFPQSQIRVKAKRSEFGNAAVTVTLDPVGRIDVPAGRYTGTLSVAGRRIQAGAVTIEATLRDSAREAFFWAILGFIAGVVIKVGGDFSRAQPSVPNPTTRVPTKGEYFFSGSFLSSLVLGLVGAAIAFALTYYDNPIWGGDQLDNWRLGAAALAGVLTGATGADLIKPLRPPAAGSSASGTSPATGEAATGGSSPRDVPPSPGTPPPGGTPSPGSQPPGPSSSAPGTPQASGTPSASGTTPPQGTPPASGTTPAQGTPRPPDSPASGGTPTPSRPS
jgi:hypothetical protein